VKMFNESAALGLMRDGQSLVRTNTRRGARWFLADGQVTNETAQRLIARSDVEQFDPGLFVGFAQSYVVRSQANG
jgi:hypothetical protein